MRVMFAAASRDAGDIKQILGGEGETIERPVWGALNMDAWAADEGVDAVGHRDMSSDG